MKNNKGSDGKKNRPIYPIGIVAELIGTTDQTLRLYEKNGLIKPSRRNKSRYYSQNDVQWLECIRDIIHEKKISIPAIKKLLEYAPCWEIRNCSEEQKESCSALIEQTKPCWQLNRMICSMEADATCDTCIVYQSQKNLRN